MAGWVSFLFPKHTGLFLQGSHWEITLHSPLSFDFVIYNLATLAYKLFQLCPTVCDALDCTPPGSSVHGILQARVLIWVAMPSSEDLPDPGIEPGSLVSPALARVFFYCSCHLGSPSYFHSVQFSSVTQLCPTLCNPMTRSTPGLPVHHHLPEFTQTHVHQVSDAIQPSHPLSSPLPPAPNLSQHQSLFQ